MEIIVKLNLEEESFFKKFIEKITSYGFRDSYYIIEDQEFLSSYADQIRNFDKWRIFDVCPSHKKTPGSKFILRSKAKNLIKIYAPEIIEKISADLV